MSPATRLLQSAQTTARSPFPLPPPLSKTLGLSDDSLVPFSEFTPDGHFLIPPSLSTPNSALRTSPSSPTSAPNSLAFPIPALVPSTLVESVDTNPSKLISSKPNSQVGPLTPQRGNSATAQAEGSAQARVEAPATSSPEGATQMSDTLTNLLHTESILGKTLTTLDPLSAPFTLALQNLASLRYHIAAEIAQQAALQDPKFTKDLIKATAIVQRDHHRLAREAAAKEREHIRRQREREQDARYKQRQHDTELKYKRKLELAKLAIEKLDKKTKLASSTRDNHKNYKTKNTEPNPHNQPQESNASSHAIAPMPSQQAIAPTI